MVLGRPQEQDNIHCAGTFNILFLYTIVTWLNTNIIFFPTIINRVYTDRWTTLVAMVPSFICWIFNCIFIGFSVCRLWVLSKYTGSSNRRISSGRSSGRSSGSSRGDEYGDVLEGEVDTMSSIRSGFIPVIRKMILFPLVTLILWSIPIAEVS
jgi:hypothetical protein